MVKFIECSPADIGKIDADKIIYVKGFNKLFEGKDPSCMRLIVKYLQTHLTGHVLVVWDGDNNSESNFTAPLVEAINTCPDARVTLFCIWNVHDNKYDSPPFANDIIDDERFELLYVRSDAIFPTDERDFWKRAGFITAHLISRELPIAVISLGGGATPYKEYYHMFPEEIPPEEIPAECDDELGEMSMKYPVKNNNIEWYVPLLCEYRNVTNDAGEITQQKTHLNGDMKHLTFV